MVYLLVFLLCSLSPKSFSPCVSVGKDLKNLLFFSFLKVVGSSISISEEFLSESVEFIWPKIPWPSSGKRIRIEIIQWIYFKLKAYVLEAKDACAFEAVPSYLTEASYLSIFKTCFSFQINHAISLFVSLLLSQSLKQRKIINYFVFVSMIKNSLKPSMK